MIGSMFFLIHEWLQMSEKEKLVTWKEGDVYIFRKGGFIETITIGNVGSFMIRAKCDLCYVQIFDITGNCLTSSFRINMPRVGKMLAPEKAAKAEIWQIHPTGIDICDPIFFKKYAIFL